MKLENLRLLLDETDETYDEIISTIVKMNIDILKEHKTLTYIFDVRSVRMEDVKHLLFVQKLIEIVQTKFKDEHVLVYITGTNQIFKFIYNKISFLILPELLHRITIE